MTLYCLTMEHAMAELETPLTMLFILAAGSLQRAFPNPHSDMEGGGVSEAVMPEGIARDPAKTEMRPKLLSNGGAASESGLPQAQAASAAQVHLLIDLVIVISTGIR